jgi:hypothetical protein
MMKSGRNLTKSDNIHATPLYIYDIAENHCNLKKVLRFNSLFNRLLHMLTKRLP